MPVSLPYLATNKNLATLFDKIASAKIPDTFTYQFLQTTIGLKGSNDRALITLLRNLGFLDQSNSPTNRYRLLKGENRQSAIAAGIKSAYASLFDADQLAHKLSAEKLKSLVAQVAGTDDVMTGRIASTFNTLVKLGNFENNIEDTDGENESDKNAENDVQQPAAKLSSSGKSIGLKTEFHYNIQVHLPSNGTEEVYLHIFNALRKTFQ